MKYMLDTNMIIYMKEHMTDAEKIFRSLPPNDICISSITYAELEYGICHSKKKAENRIAVMLIISDIFILPFDAGAAVYYGQIREELTAKGQLIGANDMLIAAHAKSQKLTLVTNNTKEFARVSGLKLENWAIKE